LGVCKFDPDHLSVPSDVRIAQDIGARLEDIVPAPSAGLLITVTTFVLRELASLTQEAIDKARIGLTNMVTGYEGLLLGVTVSPCSIGASCVR
jgi:hypothetical protein